MELTRFTWREWKMTDANENLFHLDAFSIEVFKQLVQESLKG